MRLNVPGSRSPTSLQGLNGFEGRPFGGAGTELGCAHGFDHVIPSHDGEDGENWDAFYYPVGAAFEALAAFAVLLAGEVPDNVGGDESGRRHPIPVLPPYTGKRFSIDLTPFSRCG